MTNKSKHKENFAINVDSYEERNPQKIANNFNNFFQEAPSKVINNIQKDSEYKPNFVTNTSRIYLCTVTKSELEGILKHKLKNKRSSGFDDISGYIIIKINNLLIPVLTYLVNLTFCEGQFPTILKIKKDTNLPDGLQLSGKELWASGVNFCFIQGTGI